MFLTFSINQYTGRAQLINQEGQLAEAAVEGIPIRVDRKNPYKSSPTHLAASAAVEVLGKSALLSVPRIHSWITGTY